MPMLFLILLLVCCLYAMAGKATGQIYKWVDEKGTVHFSDSPTSDVLKPQGKQTSKERTLEVVTGVDTSEPSKEELLIEYLKKRDREQEAIRQAEQERQERMQEKILKAIKDQQEELQWRRDRAADMLEKEARKKKVIKDHHGRVIWEGTTKEQQEMLRDAARLRSGLDPQPPPPSDPSEVKKWKRRAREAENEARNAENKARDAENKARDAERKARETEWRALDAERKAREAEWGRKW